MPSKITATWNPVIGCLHHCRYCFARDLALGRLRHLPRYRAGFKPALVEQELGKRFQKGLIFVSDMGDLWGKWVPEAWIERVLKVVRASPQAFFLFLTKNPQRYHEFLSPPHCIAGATIESNRYYREIGSQAPYPEQRKEAMVALPHPFRMVSIEPIMDFDLEVLLAWLREISPRFVSVGYDNHNKGLLEPSLEKTRSLISALSQFTEVRAKTLREAFWREKEGTFFGKGETDIEGTFLSG